MLPIFFWHLIRISRRPRRLSQSEISQYVIRHLFPVHSKEQLPSSEKKQQNNNLISIGRKLDDDTPHPSRYNNRRIDTQFLILHFVLSLLILLSDKDIHTISSS